MMKKLITLLGWEEARGCAGARVKEVEYHYVFTPPVCGEGAGAVCVG